MASSAEISGLKTASREDRIANYITGMLLYTILCAQISVMTAVSLTWLVYDIALTADTEVRLIYSGLVDAKLTTAGSGLPATKVCYITILAPGKPCF
jgi:hypothetical protein